VDTGLVEEGIVPVEADTALVVADIGPVDIARKADIAEAAGTAAQAGIVPADTAVENPVPLHTTAPKHN
jgi:hypothetical protein